MQQLFFWVIVSIYENIIGEKLLLVVVEVQVTHVGYEGWNDLPLLYPLPIYILEEGMLLYVFYFQSGHRIVRQQQLYQFPGTHTHVLWQVQVAIAAFFHDGFGVLCFVLILKRNEASYHLTNEDADAPDIRLISMPNIGHHDLRSTVARRATICIRPVRFNIQHFLCKTKVNDLYMAVVVD